MVNNSCKLMLIATCLGLSACTFVKDRSAESIEVVDATGNDLSIPNQTPVEAVKPVNTTVSYTVQEGDTLGIIANKTLGDSSRYKEIAELNHFSWDQPIFAGQRLLIPANSFAGTVATQAYQRPSVTKAKLAESTIKKEQLADYSELETLINNQQINPAIDWILSQERLADNPFLQNKLLELSEQQVALYNQQQQYNDSQTLVNGLLSDQRLSSANKQRLALQKSTTSVYTYSQQAAQYWSQNKSDKSYQQLLNAFTLNAKAATEHAPFTQTRNLLTEQYHQQALKLYRNQQLYPALKIWNKILAIKPNDDLALVYKDRVVNLQSKLKDL